jgi:hypothetical protein
MPVNHIARGLIIHAPTKIRIRKFWAYSSQPSKMKHFVLPAASFHAVTLLEKETITAPPLHIAPVMQWAFRPDIRDTGIDARRIVTRQGFVVRQDQPPFATV